MKYFRSDILTPYLGILIILAAAGLAVLATQRSHEKAQPAPAQRSGTHPAPPPGYTLETNGQAWRWSDSDEFHDIWPADSRQDAIDSAWRQYLYGQQQAQHPWRPEPFGHVDPTAQNAR